MYLVIGKQTNFLENNGLNSEILRKKDLKWDLQSVRETKLQSLLLDTDCERAL